MLGFRDPKRGKMVEAVDVLSLQPKMNCETFPPKGSSRSTWQEPQPIVSKMLEDRFDKLDEIIRAMQGGNIYGGFKIWEFEKYDGTTCPSMHLIVYCLRMSPYLENEKLLIHCFQDNLLGSITRRYTQLSRVNIRTCQDLSRAFLEENKYVTDMVPSRITLQDVEQMSNESFRQYAQRWRDVAAQVQPPLLESEVTPMFVEILTSPFYDHMLNHATKDFADMVLNREFILAAIISGRLKEEEYDEH
ncbi:hypothetical protein GQ457_02G030100 [Hibiscus cannabinus]